jgi:elongation factor G
MDKVYPEQSRRVGTLLEQRRNIGIIAHIDAGKTTITERILYHTGLTYRMGNVDEGSTVTDFMPQERERGITIQSAAVTCFWHDHQINIIDTPGHIDFTAEVQRSLRVLDGGVVILDGVAGVEPQTETVWRQADRYEVPRVCFVNKMDRTGAHFWRTLDMVTKRLGARAVAIQMPIGEESCFRGVVDLVEQRAIVYNALGECSRTSDDGDDELTITEIPPELQNEAQRRREQLIERLADVDDEVAERYLEGEELTPELLHAVLRQATLAGQLVPFLCGTALGNKGVQPLLDAIVAYLPSPLDVPASFFTNGGQDLESGKKIVCQADESEPLAALVFKINTDPFVGRLAYLRVYSGTLHRGQSVINASRGEKVRIGRLVRMFADRREEVDEIGAADIGAVLGLEASTGDTICATERPIVLEKIAFPTPVMSVAIRPQSKADQDRMSLALHRLAEEDPTFQVRQDSRTKETVISGMGELHLEVIVDRMKREFKVIADAGAPQVAYYETITRPVTCEARLKRQTGGHGQYAHVVLELEPLERCPERVEGKGSGFVFEEKLRGAAIPRQYVPAVEAGIRDALEQGVLTKHPLVDIKATLVDGSYHEVDSSDRAFRTAAAMALRDGVSRARPIILEPIVRIEVVAPEDYTGDVIGDLSARGGTIVGIGPRANGLHDITAHVPLATMFGYATSLRSRTQGRGTFSMEFDHYAQVPAETAQELMKRCA